MEKNTNTNTKPITCSQVELTGRQLETDWPPAAASGLTWSWPSAQYLWVFNIYVYSVIICPCIWHLLFMYILQLYDQWTWEFLMYLCTFIYSLCLADPHLVPSCKYLLFIRVGESVESALSELSAIFSALSAYFINFQQKIPIFWCVATKESLI